MRALLAAARPAPSRIVARGPWIDPRLIRLAIVGLIVGLLATNAWLAIELTTAKAESYRERQIACAAQARELITRKPILANTLELADRCAWLHRLQGREA